MKKTTSYIVALATALALTACSSDESIGGAGKDDVIVKASVGSLTRSNPIGTVAEQAQFNAGDQIRLSNGTQDAVYTLTNGEWVTTNTPVKWQSQSGTFQTCYPGTNRLDYGFIQTDQSTLENLTASDYMTQTINYTSIPDDRTLSIQLQRQTARVIFKVERFTDEFEGRNPVIDQVATNSTVEVPSNSPLFLEEITTYNNNGEYIALIAPTTAQPDRQLVKLIVKTDDNTTGTTVYATGMPAMEAGKSYTYKLVVGKNRVTIASVSVEDWTTGTAIPGGEMVYNAAKTLQNYISEQIAAGKTAITVTLEPDAGSDMFAAITNAITASGVAHQSIDLTINGALTLPTKAFVDVYTLKSLTAPQVTTVKMAAIVGSSIETINLGNAKILEKYAIGAKIKELTLGAIEDAYISLSLQGISESAILKLPEGQKELIIGVGGEHCTAASTLYSETDDWKKNKFLQKNFKAIYVGERVMLNGHVFVNLGLPSGTLWAETNIGADKEADDGNYYAWGETATQSEYSIISYKYNIIGSLYKLSKYNTTDGKGVLDQEDDAAYVNWGTSCRMPTSDEFVELHNTDNCTWTWSSKSNSSSTSVNGYLVTSKKNGYSIFLPASGSINYSTFIEKNSYGYYWSSTLRKIGNQYETANASTLNFSTNFIEQDYCGRNYGCSVRPVANKP